MESILLQIGLSDKEIEVYLASLHHGAQPASVISRHTNINRTTVYDIFSGLIKKGLANKIEKESATYFEVLDPKHLINYIERETNEYIKRAEVQKESIQEILPLLQSLQNPTSSKPKVKFYEGAKGVREAYEDTLTSSTFIRAYANVQTMHDALPNFFPEYYDRRAKANIFIHTISPDNTISLERKSRDAAEMREMRLIDRNLYEFSPETNIYDDKVLIASWKEKMALIIKSEEIADFHRKIFDMLWSKLEE